MTPQLPASCFLPLLDLALKAGRAIMEVYEGTIEVTNKADESPLTAADLASHRVIAEGLARDFPDIYLLSEEGREEPFETRARLTRLWIVDPLDGTKEFIKRNGEFTVNIALVEGGRPVWGVVSAPALGVTYWGGRGYGAFRIRAGGTADRIRAASEIPGEGVTVVKSRSHPSPELEEYLAGIKVAGVVDVGSSLKFCAVAEGRAHLYPRLGPTMEWDTAAGQAVLEGAGGRVVDLSGRPLSYNKENLRNGHFLAECGA